MRKLLVIISVLFFLLSCDQIHYSNIPEDQKPLLVDNDTIYYSDSANNRIDTFCVKVSDEYTVSDKRYYYEIVTIRYQILNRHSAFKEFHTRQGAISAHISFDGHGFHRSIFTDEDNTDIIKNNLNIHGTIYPTVYVLKDYYMPDSIPNTVYYTFQHGIIRYDYSEGRKYEVLE